MTIKEKIQEYLEYKGISPTAAERELGWGVGAFTKAKSITVDRAKEFLLLYNDLSAEWLFRGINEQERPMPQTIFHYTNIESFAKILLSNEFRLSSFCNANDYKEKIHFLNRTDDYKYISFTSAQNELYSHINPVMWNYYANKSNGVCIEFDRERLIQQCKPLHEGYIKYRLGVTHIDIQNDIEYLMEKREDWSYEHEYRFIYTKSIECIHNIFECIIGIYFGCKVPKKVIERFASHYLIYDRYNDRSITLYDTNIDSTDGRFYSLDVYGRTMWMSPIKKENADIKWLLCEEGKKILQSEDSNPLADEELKKEIFRLETENKLLRELIGLKAGEGSKEKST